MKHLIRVSLVFLLVLLMLCGCGKTEDPVDTQPPVTTEAPVQEQPTETEAVTEETVPAAPPVPLEPVAEENVANFQYALTEAATFPNSEKFAFSSHMPVVRTVSGGVTTDHLYSYTGQLMIAEGCNNYDYFGNGVAVMYTGDNTRLANVYTGDVYLESSEIGLIMQMNDRYYFAVYNTYGQVYDLERQCFIDGLQVTDLTLSSVPRAIGSTVFEKVDYGTYRIYLGDGSVKGEMDNMSFTENGFIQEADDALLVYDSECNLLATVKDARARDEYISQQANTYSWKYYATGEFLNYNVIDINSNPVLPGTYTGVYVHGDYIVTGDDKEVRGMYLADGTQVLEHNYSSIVYSEDLHAFRLTTTADEQQLYVPGCGIWDMADYQLSGAFITNGKDSFMILSTGEFVTLKDARELLGTGLVSCDQGLVSVYTGATVLEPGYDFVTATEEHLYVLKDGTWNVYGLELVKN